MRIIYEFGTDNEIIRKQRDVAFDTSLNIY